MVTVYSCPARYNEQLLYPITIPTINYKGATVCAIGGVAGW